MNAGLRTIIRSFTSSAIRRGHGHHEVPRGPGSTLPFRIDNPYRLTAYFVLFFGSACGLPFILVRHHLTK